MGEEPGTTRILIADDHPIFRHGLRVLLEAEPGFAVVGEVADGTDALQLLPQLKADILLLDLGMPRLSGMEVLRELAAAPGLASGLRAIVLTVAIEKNQIVEALQLGARGVVLKDGATELLIKAIRTVVAGQYWVGRESVGDLVEYLRIILPQAAGKREEAPFGLTQREREIISGIVEGLTNREIAEKLSIAEETVKHHLSSIFDKTSVQTRLQLALLAVRHSLVKPPPGGYSKAARRGSMG
jgi:two-component system, NarL family, nitrate/nitrite response regulator NarL